MTITMFGIPNCDTIKKAKKWLEAEEIAYEFHDYRKQGIDAALVTEFCDALGWEVVVNKRGTTFRQLTQEQKDALNQENAIQLLVENTSHNLSSRLKKHHSYPHLHLKTPLVFLS